MLRARYFIALFYLLMLLVPTTLQTVRGVFLGLLIFASFIVLISFRGSWKIERRVLFVLLVCVAISLIAILNGVVNNAPGAIPMVTVYVVWPLLFVYFIGFNSRFDGYLFLTKTLIFGIFLASLSQLIYVLSAFLGISIFKAFYELQGGAIGFYEGTVEFNLYNMTTSIYGLPFLIALIMIMKYDNAHIFPGLWPKFIYSTFVLTFLSLLVSGRRGFMLVFILAVPICISIMFYAGKKINYNFKKIALYIFLLIPLFLIYVNIFGLNIEIIYKDFMSGFDFQDIQNASAYRRYEQFNSLITDWQLNPFFGAGLGAFSLDNKSVPIENMPWAYELQYIALLFQTGIFGVLIYSSAVIWLVFQMIRLSAIFSTLSVLMIPALVGMVCFLIVNMTNPYLSKFDYIWSIFFCVGLVNYGLLKEKNIFSRKKLIVAANNPLIQNKYE
jgi:hypothetical protein